MVYLFTIIDLNLTYSINMSGVMDKCFIPGYREAAVPDTAVSRRLLLMRPYVRQAGNSVRPTWAMESRKLLDYLLVFIGSGYGIFTVGDETFEVEKDDLIWIPPDTPHAMSGTSKTMHCIYIHIDLFYDPERSHWDACIPRGTLDLSDYKHFMHPPVDDPVFGVVCGKLKLENPDRIKDLMTDICRIHERRQGRAVFPLSAMTLELLAEIADQLETENTSVSFHYRKLRNAAADITRNPEEKLNIRELAKRYSLSEPHFRKLFREFHGMGPRAMHQQAVIRKACELLVYSSMSISEIADELNFGSIYSFSRAFKNALNVSPRQYREGGKKL